MGSVTTWGVPYARNAEGLQSFNIVVTNMPADSRLANGCHACYFDTWRWKVRDGVKVIDVDDEPDLGLVIADSCYGELEDSLRYFAGCLLPLNGEPPLPADAALLKGAFINARRQ